METFNVTKVSGKKIFPLPLRAMARILPEEPFRWKKIIQYLLQGLLIIAPVAVTAYSIYWVVSTVDKWIPLFSEPVRDASGHITHYAVKNYGLGFLIILVAIILIGYLSSVFIQSRLFGLFDSWLEKTPGVKYIYSSVRDFFGAVAGEKKRFNIPILANVFSEDVWVMGFLTDEELAKLDLGAEMVSVYIPQAYHWAGQLYVLPRAKVKKIEKFTPGEAMKYAVTGGVVELVDEKKGK
jgi:uncharacterized membrane protein